MISTVHSAVTELPHGLVLVDPSGPVGHDTPHGPTVTPLISTVSRHAEAISRADLTLPEDLALPGPTLFVPRGIPHAAINLSTTEPVVAFEVHGTSDVDVDLRADLEHRMHAAVAALRGQSSPPPPAPRCARRSTTCPASELPWTTPACIRPGYISTP
ncbi:MAG: hypothetical protein ACRCSN_07460, partial [Dermatophilaceae bacterium]